MSETETTTTTESPVEEAAEPDTVEWTFDATDEGVMKVSATEGGEEEEEELTER